MQEAAKSLQTMTDLKAGAETAIYAMRTIFEDPLTEGVTLVDASNDFNSLNQKLAPHNIQIACPSFSYNLINSYQTSSRMIIMGGAEIQSAECTTQGNTLAMSLYVIASVQIQQLLRISVPDVK